MIYISANGGQIFQTLVREKLTGNRTYYVRTDGNDNNDGLADSPARAFLSIQRAIDLVAFELDVSNYQVTIQVGPGTYTNNLFLRVGVGHVPPIIQGTPNVPTDVIVTTDTSTTITGQNGDSLWELRDMEVRNTNGAGNCVFAQSGSVIRLRRVDFGSSAGGQHLISYYNSTIIVSESYTIRGGAAQHAFCSYNSSIVMSDLTLTLSGTPAFASRFISATAGGIIRATNFTYTGSATGTRYLVQSNGVIATTGAGASYFPGSLAGSTATGGQYI
jgi:hypothetical protein